MSWTNKSGNCNLLSQADNATIVNMHFAIKKNSFNAQGSLSTTNSSQFMLKRNKKKTLDYIKMLKEKSDVSWHNPSPNSNEYLT